MILVALLFPTDFKSPNPNLFLYLFVGPNGDLDLEIHVSKRAFLYFGQCRVFQFRTFPSNSLSLFRDPLFSANAIASSSLPQVLTLVHYSSFFLSFQLFSV